MRKVLVLVVAVLVLVHQVDHLLRGDVSGWPFTGEATWFTASLLLYPALLAGLLLLGKRPWVGVAVAVVLVGVVQVPHLFWETPADQYGTWAHGVSWTPAAPERPNLLGISSPALGVGVDRPLTAGPDDRLARVRRLGLPAVPGPPRPHPAAGGDGAGPPRRSAGRAGPGGFLWSTGTTAFLAIKGDTLVSEVYFRGYDHDATVSSFSVAKPVVSALVGIAIAQGRIGSVDDPVSRYLPELARRDPRFGRITLRHLLTMTSGLADLDPSYDLDLRATALRDTRIVELSGRRCRYNNINPILLGMVLERVTGGTVSAYLSERLWGPLGTEADGSWSLDSRRSGLELLQAGLNGRPVDFAKLGALYLHRGAWQGRQLVPRRWVTESTRADTRTDYNYDHWPDLLGPLARRL